MSRHPRRPKNIPNIVGVDLFCGVGGLNPWPGSRWHFSRRRHRH
ncbi:hypothetical protein [Xylella fastidiosa]|nr:hypothetical protein [Xylella fastidiosa]